MVAHLMEWTKGRGLWDGGKEEEWVAEVLKLKRNGKQVGLEGGEEEIDEE